MTTCIKYKCDKCGQQFDNYSDVENTWFGNNKAQYSSLNYWTLNIPSRRTKKKQIEQFVRLELGDLCKNCFKNAKQLLKEWKDNSPKVECE